MRHLAIFLILAIATNASFALNPSRTYKQRPDRYNMAFEEFKVKTNDGQAELNVWSFPAKNGNSGKLMLIAHNGEGNMADYLRRVDSFVNMGYHVVMFDYRGYGESSEFEIDPGMYIYPHFTDDYESMLDFCRKQYQQQFDLYGWGIGAGLSLGIGYQRPEVQHIVADTPFYSMEDLENRFSEWDEPMEVPFAGYEKRFEPLYSVENTPGKNLKKVMLIIGSNDILYSIKDMEALKAKAPKMINKDIYVVENPDRKDNYRIKRADYTNKVKAFLASN